MKRPHYFSIIIVFTAVIFFLILFTLYIICPMYYKKIDLSSTDYYIAHAGGMIDGHTYTNSLEAVLLSIQKGYKYIELDLQLTTDSQLVCMHSIEDYRKMTNTPDSIDISFRNFIKNKIYGRYTPLSAKEIALIIMKYNITLVTDKISDPIILERYFSKVRNHVIVEAFSLHDYQELKKLGYCPMLNIRSEGIKRNYIKKCIENNCLIDCISTSATNDDIMNYRILKKLFGVKIITYSPQDPLLLKNHIGREIDLIYIDDKDILKH